jgi:hypothetical protein
MRAAVAAALVLLAVPVAAALAKPPASYRVTVQATLHERAVYSLTGDAACFWSARGIAVRQLEIETAAPATLTAAQLAHGVGVPLEVHELRLGNHNNVIGACTRLGPQISDPDDLCGKRAYRIPASDVTLRLHNGRIAFSFLRVAADPYANRCAPSVWGAVPQSGRSALIATLSFPPRRASVPIDARQLGSGKPTVATWTGTVSTANATLGRSDVATGSWRVALERAPLSAR